MKEHAYHMDRHYRSLTIWSFNPVSRQRVSVTKRKPDVGLTRRGRFRVLAELLEEYDIFPDYQALDDQDP